MTREIIQFSGHVGGSSLFREDTVLEYRGPSRDRFVSILKNTYEFFNKYDISDIGFSDDQLESILNSMSKKCTIGVLSINFANFFNRKKVDFLHTF